MDMTGEQRIAASREAVWNALNDPEVLRRCIPGCQELTKESEDRMTAVAVIKVGPISARFQGAVTLSELDPPSSYRISGEGKGGVAGHARGGAVVRLTEDGDATVLHYEVEAQVGGRLAQLGGRMIDATAKTMSTAFFRQFALEVTGEGAAAREQANAGVPQDSSGAQSQRTVGAPAQRGFRPSSFLAGALAGGIAAFVLGPAGGQLLSGISPNVIVGMIFAIAAGTGLAVGRTRG